MAKFNKMLYMWQKYLLQDLDNFVWYFCRSLLGLHICTAFIYANMVLCATDSSNAHFLVPNQENFAHHIRKYAFWLNNY